MCKCRDDSPVSMMTVEVACHEFHSGQDVLSLSRANASAAACLLPCGRRLISPHGEKPQRGQERRFMISEGEGLRQIHRSSPLQQVSETILQRGMILPTRMSRPFLAKLHIYIGGSNIKGFQ